MKKLMNDEPITDMKDVFLKALSADAFSTKKKIVKESENFDRDSLSAKFLTALREASKRITHFVLSSYLPKERALKVLRALKAKQPNTKIHILTIHGSKGLEADNVFLLDGITYRIHENMFFHVEEIENEHRVWYVGLTRARKNTFIAFGHFLDRRLNLPSPVNLLRRRKLS